MQGRIRNSLALIVALGFAIAPAAAAHDVTIESVHATVPKVTWQPHERVWIIDLAGLIACQGANRVEGVLMARPLDTNTIASIRIQGAPSTVQRQSSNALGPGRYELTWFAATCIGEAQSDDDPGDHVGELTNVVVTTFRLPDCGKPGAAQSGRTTLRPLVPVDSGMPPNAEIGCPLPQPEPCGARSRAALRNPLVPVTARTLTVVPCESGRAPEEPAVDAQCGGTGGGARAARVRRPLLPVGPRGSVPPSTRTHCSGQIELRSASPQPGPCLRRVRDPLLPVACAPPSQAPPTGYAPEATASAAAASRRIAAFRFRIRKGTRETLVLELTPKQRRAATRGALRLVLTFRDRSGKLHRSRSGLYTLD